MQLFLCRIFLCSLFSSAVWGVAGAQALNTLTFELGVVLPLSGDSARTGQVAAAALRASAETLKSAGIDLELTVLDSRSNAVYAAAQAQTLIGTGIHALLCCETAEVTARVQPLVTAADVPTLSLSPVTSVGGAPQIIFSLSADDSQTLTRLALEPPQPPLALMAPFGASGNLAKDILGSVSVGVVRYPAARTQAVTPLTPEALLVATREPGSVVIWDAAEGTLRAAEALTARGFAGVRAVRAEVWGELDALERAELSGAVSAVSPAVLGYRLPDTQPSKGEVSSFRRALRSAVFSSDVATVTTAAGAWDAAQLLGAAAEQLLTYTDPTTLSTVTVRAALRDALIGLGPVVGAGGSYDFSGDSASGLLPDSLVLAAWRSGRFFPYP